MTSNRLFSRRTEDFTCGRCGAAVAGDGYTNHCPRCLWSRHVDVNPGDRAADCGGLMEPVEVSSKRDRYVILHRCTVCGHERRNKVAPGDNFEVLLKVSSARR
jgi:rubrerythrin